MTALTNLIIVLTPVIIMGWQLLSRMDSKMNERIKELAEQATSLYQTMEGEWEEDFDKEKFAELIVRECIDQLYYTREERMDDTICQAIKERIEKHFGVEE